MNLRKMLIITLAIFVMFMAVDWIIHGQVLSAFYKATLYLWRDMEEMHLLKMFKYLVEAYFYFSLFNMFKSSDTLSLGMGIGLITGITSASSYLYMPISEFAAAMWFSAQLVKGIVAAVLFNMLKD